MEKEQAAVLQQVVRRFHVDGIVGTAYVFQHADADDAVISPAFFNQVAVVDQVDLHLPLQSQGFDAFLPLFPLFVAQRAAIALYAVFLRRFDEQVAPAAADVEEAHARLQMQLFQNIVDLIVLGLFERIVFLLEISAGIAHRRVKP